MKTVLFLIFLSLAFYGCGGSSSSVASNAYKEKEKLSSFKRPYIAPPVGSSYTLSNYLVPQSSSSVTISKEDMQGTILQTQELVYAARGSEVLVRGAVDSKGDVGYLLEDNNSTLVITLYHDKKKDSYKLYNFVNLHDRVTRDESGCYLNAAHASFGGFEDVLEIACPTGVGYYAKDHGLVIQKQKSAAQAQMFLPSYHDRKIGSIDGYEVKNHLATLNVESAIAAKVDKLWAAPYRLRGEGMRIGIVDGGSVLATHVELAGRVENLSRKDSDLHTTHVAGTLISEGKHLEASRGFANGASLYSLSYYEQNFSESLIYLYDRYSVRISNHSYGYEGPEGLGVYDTVSSEVDQVMYTHPDILAVFAAGNDGSAYQHDSEFTYWGLIKGGSNAKNALTVASVDQDNERVSDFSSRGPIRGGRMKPDIAADGENILSTSNYDNTAYKRMRGTSMAAPAVTGSVTLLAEYYKRLTGVDLRMDTLKAVLFNTAKDIGNRGPDYKSGYGAIDAYSALKSIESLQSDAPLLQEGEIEEGEKLAFSFDVEGYTPFKVSVAWLDLGGAGLLNDLDIYLVEEKSGKKFYPFTLNEHQPDQNARQDQANHLDPQEQIVAGLSEGSYTLYIEGTKLKEKQIHFALASNISLGESHSNIMRTPLHLHLHEIYQAIQ